MLNIISMLKGYVEIEIRGSDPEGLINRCTNEGLSFWRLQKTGDMSIKARILITDYLQLKKVIPGEPYDVKVLANRGAPFLVWRFRKRYIFIAFMLLSVVMVYSLSQRIWKIEVSGNVGINDEKIIRVLEHMGVGIGTPVSAIDFEMLKDDVLLKIDDLAWFALNVRGSTAIAEVREREGRPEVVDEKTSCNIVAKKAGIISKVHVLEGTRQVAAGDSVTEGQLIASGVIDTAIGMRLVHAMAVAEAETRYFLSVKIPLEVRRKEYTGESTRKYALNVAGRRINFYFNGSISYDKYDNIIEYRQPQLPGGYILPITLSIEEKREYKLTPATAEADFFTGTLRDSLTERLHSMLDEGKVISTEFKEEIKDNVLTVSLTAVCKEDIAKAALIPIWNELGG